jgi:exo-beta-1,3-glucanase (GH17 family)
MRYLGLASLLAASALAQPIAHEHHAHKREAAPVEDYVTVQVTYTVTANPGAATNVASAANELATASVNSQISLASAYSAPNQQQVPTTTLAVAVSTPAAADSASSSDASASSSPAVGSGGALGITYSPYTNSGGCKSASQVAADLAYLTGFDVIRLYGVDCNQVANVYAAKQSSQKLFLGLYDMGSIASDLETLKEGINSDWSCVHTISVGNELVNSGEATPAQVGSYVQTARGILQSYGYTGPVVSVDTFIAVIENPELCQYSDYMGVNAHAFFDGGVTADQAGEWALQQIQRVYGACSGSKSVMITESGWPSAGENNGVAVPSQDNQNAAISSLKSSIGNDVLLFQSFNNLWKSPGYLNVEQWWGIFGDSSS